VKRKKGLIKTFREAFTLCVARYVVFCFIILFYLYLGGGGGGESLKIIFFKEINILFENR